MARKSITELSEGRLFQAVVKEMLVQRNIAINFWWDLERSAIVF